MGEGMKGVDHNMKAGNRQSTIDCMAKVVRAMLVCGRVTIKVLAYKADISEDTARRAIAGLRREGLVTREDHRNPSKEFTYVWAGAQD